MAKSKVKITLDHQGIRAILQSDEVAADVHDAAEEVARRLAGHPSIVRNELEGKIEVEDYITDRAVSSVTITHAAGKGIQAKYGALTQAAGGGS